VAAVVTDVAAAPAPAAAPVFDVATRLAQLQ